MENDLASKCTLDLFKDSVRWIFGWLDGFLAMGFAGEAFREQQKTGSKHPVSKIIFENMENASLQKMMNSISAAGGGF